MLKLQSRKLSLILASFLWVILLLVLAMEPEPVILWVLRKKTLFPYAHVAAYALLSFLFCVSFRFNRMFWGIRMNTVLLSAFSFLSCFICGGVTEAVQIFSPDRIPDWNDIMCDLYGAVLGIVFFAIYSVRKRTIIQVTYPQN